MAVEGFSESLQHELKPFNIKVKIIEPGPIKTDFYSRSMDFSTIDNVSPYQSELQRATENMQTFINYGGSSKEVAKVIYNAANSNSNKLRYSAGTGASFLLLLRKILPDGFFNKTINWVIMR